jgi:4'-phosphopantetheinyl transferase
VGVSTGTVAGAAHPAVLPGLPPEVALHTVSCRRPPGAAAWATLSPTERDRAGRFHRAEDRDRFVTARATLRRLLGERLGIEPGGITFGERGRGKPVLAEEPIGDGTHFSVSHAGGVIVIAVADRPVGVDVELVRPDAWDERMAALVLSPPELSWLAAQPDRDLAFFRCWTRKEAYAKLGDEGLVDGLRRLTLTPRPDAAAVEPGSAVLLTDARLGHDAVVACAVGSARRPGDPGVLR